MLRNLNIYIVNKHIEAYDYGVYNENTIKCFQSGNGINSLISDYGTDKIKLIKLDDFISENVTFIKMDIEGAEMPALEGCKKTIEKYKPKLAICVYHKVDDLWKIPLFIKKLNPEYKLYLRHYSSTFAETVCYAI